jgi:hypothetical protein
MHLHTPQTDCRLLQAYRLDEFSLQVDAMRKGLATVVPVQLLSLFTWSELELMVCGQAHIDLDFLKAHTVYEHPVRATDAHVLRFWRVLHTFSHKERQAFIGFVWGQSRLPADDAHFTQKFKISPFHAPDGNIDGSLPRTHTCFFSIELPAYTTDAICAAKLRFSIVHCLSVELS